MSQAKLQLFGVPAKRLMFFYGYLLFKVNKWNKARSCWLKTELIGETEHFVLTLKT